MYPAPLGLVLQVGYVVRLLHGTEMKIIKVARPFVVCVDVVSIVWGKYK